MTNRVVHFEFSAGDPERAKAFFESAFAWRFEKWAGGAMDHWTVSTGGARHAAAPGIDGGMGPSSEMNPGVVNTISVDDLGAVIARIEAAGGEITMPPQAIPGVGWLAYFKDTESTIWGVYQDDASAA